MVNGGISHRHSVIIREDAQRCLVDSFVTKAQCFQHNTERNGYKMPDFYRLDMSLIFNVSHYDFVKSCKRKLQSQFVLSIYNVYGRKNAYAMFVNGDRYHIDQPDGYKLYLYQWIPSFDVEF